MNYYGYYCDYYYGNYYGHISLLLWTVDFSSLPKLVWLYYAATLHRATLHTRVVVAVQDNCLFSVVCVLSKSKPDISVKKFRRTTPRVFLSKLTNI